MNRSSLIRLLSLLSLSGAIAIQACAAPAEEEAPEQADGQLRNQDDVIVDEVSGKLASVDKEESGVDYWKVFLVKTTEGELYTVARGFKDSSPEDKPLVDIDLMASKPDEVTVQRLADKNDFVVDERRLAALTKELENLAKLVGSDASDCKKKRSAKALEDAAKIFFLGLASGAACASSILIVSAAGCAVGAPLTVTKAIGAVRHYGNLKCDALPAPKLAGSDR